jgi:hypothetical protein
MNANAPTIAKKISAALDTVLSKREEDRRLLAKTLGVHYRTLAYWLSADRHIPAYILPRLCTELKDYRTLDILEKEAGRLAFPLPHPETEPAIEDIRAIQALVKEVGHALEHLAETLADGKVEDHELPPAIKELDDVIRECARLKHWLRERNKAHNQTPIALVRKVK